MKGLALKYGCNPNQKLSRIYMKEGELPITVLGGRSGCINFFDALNSWQLVRELKAATGMPSAASFKYVSPAGTAIGLPLGDTLKRIYFVNDIKMELSPLACTYAKTRGADRMCSYSDFVALSGTCDAAIATLIKREVSDDVTVPDYTPETLDILEQKRKSTYSVIQVDANYVPAPIERRQILGITFEQGRSDIQLGGSLLFMRIPTKNKYFSDEAKRDLIIALIILKYTQSNGVCYVKDGQVIGIGAGRRSHIHYTHLARQKADTWWLCQCPEVMDLPFEGNIRRADRDNTIDQYIGDGCEDLLQDSTWQRFFTTKPELFAADEKRAWITRNKDIALGSDAFFPFGDNIECAHKSGVAYIAQAEGSIRDDHVVKTCDKHSIAVAMTSVRLFHR